MITRRSFAAAIVVATSLVAVAGCSAQAGNPNESSNDESTEALTTARGVDYAWGRPGGSTLKAQGYTFAARYLSYDTTGKNITAAEASSLKAAGVDVVVVWEWGASDVTKGYNEGVTEAQEAQRQALAAGMPAGRPIYFAIDYDEQSSDQTNVNAYFDGVASVLGRSRTGAYAGYYAIKRLFDAGKITWGWQTYAWSSGNWDSRAQLRQVQNGVTIGGVDCDVDNAVAADFGQWWNHAAPPPPPPPASGCYSSTLAKNVSNGTCVQASSDSNWYTCENGAWVAGQNGCTSRFPFCHSDTLNTDVPVRTCVQSRFDDTWYQCTSGGWETPVSSGAGPAGTCSSMHNL